MKEYKNNIMRKFKQVLGWFLISLPFIALGIFCFYNDGLRAFGIALLLAIVVIAVTWAGVVLIDGDEW